ncbi:unnamed protein product [Pedinophyceae sp. YPF-701]|nr:unnamed protein product [Pedinophyceae sp. YPF-701]
MQAVRGASVALLHLTRRATGRADELAADTEDHDARLSAVRESLAELTSTLAEPSALFPPGTDGFSPDPIARAQDYFQRVSALAEKHCEALRMIDDDAPKPVALHVGSRGGCGTVALAAAFPKVTGIDAEEAAVDVACRVTVMGKVTALGPGGSPTTVAYPQHIDRDRVEYLVADERWIPWDVGTADAVVTTGALDRSKNPTHLLSRLPTLVKPGGVIVVSELYGWSPVKVSMMQALAEGAAAEGGRAAAANGKHGVVRSEPADPSWRALKEYFTTKGLHMVCCEWQPRLSMPEGSLAGRRLHIDTMHTSVWRPAAPGEEEPEGWVADA